MVDQAAVNGGAKVRINSPLTEGVIGNLAELTGDVATLAELQAQLGLMDLKESAGKAALPAGGVAAAAGLALGAVPVLLFGVAELIVAYGGMRHAWALVLTSVVALALAGLVAWLAGSRLGKSFESFRRSRDELTRNVAWIKTVLAQSGRCPPPRRVY
jgi:hypothetical protein